MEVPRVGLPNLVGQGEQVARARGAVTGAEQAARETIAASLQQEAIQRAEELPPTPEGERTTRDPRDRRGGHGQREGGEADAYDDEPDEGRHIDVTA